MKIIVALVALAAMVAVASAAPLTENQAQYLFVKFAKQHNKVYSHDEFFNKFQVFRQNMEMIREHNAAGHSWSMAMNEFGDLTWAQFKKSMCGFQQQNRDFLRAKNVKTLDTSNLPSSVDWRSKNAVTPVKNQGQCGSCWSFSTTGSVEGAHAIATGNLVSLSEQQLVDCSTAEGNQGCNGGLMDNAFEYIIKNGGICSEQAYPYTATGPNQCRASSCKSVATISGYHDVAKNDELQLKAAVAQGPVSVAIEADQSGFQFYSGGVFSGTCGTQLDHGVLVVGYGTDSGKDYWLVKNSWGASWGLQGYIMLIRHDSSGSPGQCGLAMEPSYPTI
eukprot:TRINITY_DN66587_c0_g3_i1.p1 TRINITY_DN66587_c0_g3~~TRINITY_DN66587_c0_g3_i1.p1  ORF type:complete len:333 (-),score=173.84 TRINITY_DN66587_c0_g3_i1:195-1193(-)